MQFKNPENGYTEDKSAPWLWALLFGGLYFIVCGLWAPSIIWLLLAIGLYELHFSPPATILMPLVGVVYAFLAPGLVRNSYLRKGWVEVKNSESIGMAGYVSGKMQTPEEKTCPFCAEKIKYAAIKCKHCGADIEPPSAIPDAPPASDTQQMEEFGIAFDGERYVYGEYKYGKLSDAISYAKLQKNRSV